MQAPDFWLACAWMPNSIIFSGFSLLINIHNIMLDILYWTTNGNPKNQSRIRLQETYIDGKNFRESILFPSNSASFGKSITIYNKSVQCYIVSLASAGRQHYKLTHRKSLERQRQLIQSIAVGCLWYHSQNMLMSQICL